MKLQMELTVGSENLSFAYLDYRIEYRFEQKMVVMMHERFNIYVQLTRREERITEDCCKLGY